MARQARRARGPSSRATCSTSTPSATRRSSSSSAGGSSSSTASRARTSYIAQADGGTFIGDIAAFTGEPTISACVAVEPTEVIVFDRAGLREMVARWPEFGELVFRTLMARRAWHETEGHGVMRLIAPRGSRRAFEVRDLLERNLLPVRWYDVDTDAESAADARVARHPARGDAGAGARDRGDAQPLRGPGRALARAARRGRRAALRPRRARRRARPGWRPPSTAARRGCGRSSPRPGRPAARPGTSTRIENYLGFPTGISGTELTRKATLQARRFDAVLSSFHRAVELADGPEGLVRVDLDDGQHVARPLGRDGDRRALARAAGRGHRPLPRRRRLPRGDGDRRRAVPRRGRDRHRRRQLGRAGGGPPRVARPQRARGRARQGAEVDDVALPRRPRSSARRGSR